MENLGLDSRLLIAQLINFGLFFFVFKKFLAKPFTSYLEEQSKKAKEQDAVYAKTQEIEAKLAVREKELLAKVKKESAAVLEEAKKSAEALRKEAVSKAEDEAKAIVAKAHTQIEEQKLALTDEAKAKIKEVSFFMVNEALKETLSEDVRKKLTANILKRSSKSVTFYEN